ncbi:oligosaccharide flippase family protein [bacterium]|nr:oligosaccharide flippase family protein [bacterium]
MRSKRALLNFISSFARNIIATILSLAATPFILSALGEERFGAYRLLLDWLSHLGILEFGLYSASLTLLSKAATEGKESLLGTLKLIFKNYFFVFVVQVVFFVLFFFFVDRLIPVSFELQKELRLSAFVMSFSLLFLVSQIFKAYLEAVQKGYLVSVMLVVFNFFYLAQCVLFAYWQWGLLGQVVAYVTSLLVSFIMLIYFAPEVLKSFFSSQKYKAPKQLLKNQRFSHFVNELCGRISLMSDNIIISLFMGASTVTAFFITQKVGSMMQQQLQNLSNSSWAALSELYYQGKQEQFNDRILHLTELISFSSGVVLSVVCLLNPSFVSLWTGVHTFSGLSVSNLTAINAALFSILSLWSWCFAATNLTQKMVTMSIVQGVVNIIASILLTKMIGISGPLYGTLIGYAGVSMFWKSYVLCKTFQIHFLQMTLSWMRPLIPPLGSAIVYISFFGPLQINSWFSLIGFGVLFTSFFFVFSTFVLLKRETRNLLQEILQNNFKRVFKI